MGQSLVNNLVHLIYSTKKRKDMISPAIADRLWRYQAGVFQECESPAIIIGGMPDHIHALFRLSKNLALKTVVEEVKKASSKWMKAETDHDDFYWQAGYACFSVSQSNLEAVKTYIEEQAEHHRITTFQDELRAFFNRHGISFDERYVWD